MLTLEGKIRSLGRAFTISSIHLHHAEKNIESSSHCQVISERTLS